MTAAPDDAGAVPAAPVAAIDVGTNTTRLLVARVVDGYIESVVARSTMTALGVGLRPGGAIAQAGLDLVEVTVRGMAAEARALGVRRLVVACTAPARVAGNALELLDRLESAAGVAPRVLSGDQEAELAFRGIATSGAPDPLVAIDLGGGSLELMGGDGGILRWATSLPIGVRSLTERFALSDPPDRAFFEPMVSAVRELTDSVAIPDGAREAVASGGSAVALAELVGSDHLDAEELVSAVERLVASPAEILARGTGIEIARLRLLLAGAAALEAVRRSFGLDALQVSQAGIREGLVLDAAR